MSKAFGKIFGTGSYATADDYANYNNSHVDKNRGVVVPYTRQDGSIGYDLVDERPKEFNWKPTGHTFEDNLKYLHLKALDNPIYNAGNKDFSRNLWETYNQQSLRPYDNYLTCPERTEQLRNGNNLFLDIENNPNANYQIPSYRTSDSSGQFYIDNYGGIIEKYAQQYNVDPDLVKAIMYNEASTGHWGGLNELADKYRISGSQMPMNIRGDTWGDFDGQHYDTHNPEQNIELGVQLIKRLQNSIHNPTIEKVATLYNRTGAMEVNDYGARTRTIYNQKPWLRKR